MPRPESRPPRILSGVAVGENVGKVAPAAKLESSGPNRSIAVGVGIITPVGSARPDPRPERIPPKRLSMPGGVRFGGVKVGMGIETPVGIARPESKAPKRVSMPGRYRLGSSRPGS